MQKIFHSWQMLSIWTWLVRLVPIIIFATGALVASLIFIPAGENFLCMLLLSIVAAFKILALNSPWWNTNSERNTDRWVALRRSGELPQCSCGADAWLGQRHLRYGCPYAR